ncbi:MAG: alpha/beta hydrolase [Planctomycetota bacterium]
MFLETRQFNRRNGIIAAGAAGLALTATDVTAATSVDSRFRLSSGRFLGYRIYGDVHQPPVLYFHGTPGSRLEAALIADRCNAMGVYLIAIDRPGMGRSSPSSPHCVATWPIKVREIATWMQREFGFGAYRILAVSGGTSFALACASQLRPLVASVAVISPRTPFAPGVPDGVLDPQLRQLRSHPRIARRVLQMQANRVRRNPNFKPAALKKYAQIDQRYMDRNKQVLRAAYLESVRCGVDGILCDMRLISWPWHIHLEDITIPVGFWHGNCDSTARYETLTFVQSRIRHAHVVVGIGQGHFTALDFATEDAVSWLMQS